ncbi:MAG: thioredoxin family protein [Rhodospirillales bacterium]|nr:thioredoxin family protein [Rhodospirillales bacterium]
MTRILAYSLAAIVLVFAAMPVNASVEIGQPAPEIEATDTNDNAFKLSDHKGKIVVLEWTNNECPFVKKHYDSGNMQATQKAAAEKGVEWVSIVSSAPGKQGHVDAEEANKIVSDAGATVTAKILDEDGTIGKAYDAKTTPHMFVIDAEGNVAYAGAIDSNSSPNPATIEGATNYVSAAIDALVTGQPVETSQTQPYGCGVKY